MLVSVPVQNTAHEIEIRYGASFGTHARACAKENSRVRLQLMPSFPAAQRRGMPCCRGQFDCGDDTVVADARIVVQFDQAFCFGDRGFGVAGQASINFRQRYAVNELQGFPDRCSLPVCQWHPQPAARGHCSVLCPVTARRSVWRYLPDLRGVKDQRRVGCWHPAAGTASLPRYLRCQDDRW